MARKRMTEAKELAAIQSAEAARDDPAGELASADIRLSGEASAVLSVRLPREQVKLLRALAEGRNTTLSSMLQAAVEDLIASAGPRMSVSQKISRLYVHGAEMEGFLYESTSTVHQDLALPALTVV